MNMKFITILFAIAALPFAHAAGITEAQVFEWWDDGTIEAAEANELLSLLDEGNTQELKKWLIDNYGILIRDASNFRGLDNHCFRITSQTPEENNALVEALTEYIEWKKEM